MSIMGMGFVGAPEGGFNASRAGMQRLRASQISGLLPAASSPSALYAPAAVYDAVGYQAMGALGGSAGWQAYMRAMNSLDPGEGSEDAAVETPDKTAEAADKKEANITDTLLEEAGWKAPKPNPYQFSRDFFDREKEREGTG